MSSQQVKIWQDIHKERTIGQHDQTIVVGARQHFVMTDAKLPVRDFTGGGGVMPLGHGHPQVSESIQELTKYFWQTGPDTFQGIQMEFLLWLSKHFKDDWRYQFCASENEALYNAVYAVGANPEDVDWLNRKPPMADMEVWHDHRSQYPPVIVASPINPETYETLTMAQLATIYELQSKDITKIIWDETVLGMGWRGTSVFNVPFYADAVVLGGAVGGGVPLGVIGGAGMTPIPGEGRLAGSGVGVTAGLHTLRQLMVKTAHSDAAGLVERLADELARLKDENPESIKEIHGEGLLRSLQLPNDKLAAEFINECREDGALLARSGEYVKISVPLMCGLQDVDELISIMSKAIKKVKGSHGE